MDDDQLLPDGVADRSQAFLLALGISGNDYSAVTQRAIARALVDAFDPNPVPWSPFGARNIGGRIRSLGQDPLQPETLYAGTAQGGVFKSRDDGDTWAPLGAPQDAFPVGALAVDLKNPDVIYVGSGQTLQVHTVVTPGGPPPPPPPFIRGSTWEAGGTGFLRCDQSVSPPAFTTEVGAYSQVGPLPGAADQYARVVCDPNTEGRCWIASDTGLWRREPGPPVSFVKEAVPTGAPAMPPLPAPPALAQPVRAFGTNCCDVLVTANTDPAKPNTYRIFAAFSAMGIFRGVFDPATATTTWEAAPRGGGVLPAASTPAGGITHDRIRLAACRSQPDHVYAIFENGLGVSLPSPQPERGVLDVFYSNDGGVAWFASGPRPPGPPPVPPSVLYVMLGGQRGGQPWAHLIIEVHPDNPAIAIAGAMNLARTKDFGVTWDLVMDWQNWSAGDRAQHGDMHAVLFDSADPRRIFVGNDSGVLMTPDIVQGNPRTDKGWRKRSHDVLASQFNDITIHPSYPFMAGGGLQDNGSYASFGGETWYVIGDADGGQIAFEVNDPRTFIAPNQSSIMRSTVVPPTTLEPNPGRYPLVSRRAINGDRDPPNDVFACQIDRREIAPLNSVAALFLPLVEHHPTVAGHFLIGRGFTAANGPNPAVPADLIFSTNGGTSFNRGNIPPGQIGTGSISALAYGNGAPATADWWVGGTQGQLLRGGAAGGWTAMVLPPNALNAVVSRIAVHPKNSNYVAVCTTGVKAVWGGNEGGSVYLSFDRGASWADITNLPPAPGGALPPCPFTSLAFDPQPAATAVQTLFVGTLAGVYVSRSLPPIPAAPGAVPAFNPQWMTFTDRPRVPAEPANPLRGRGPLPLTVVNDLKIVSLPARTGTDVIANAAETAPRTRLIAASYGRGMYVCDITRAPALGTPAGGPPVRLYIRQTVIEDGLSYPRATPAVLNAAPGSAGAGPRLGGDPRFPVNTVQFTDREAFDIRIDNEPFQFFDDVIDGVEFDEDLKTRPVMAGTPNVVYVQVHSAGWAAAGPVDVHLYFAAAPAPGAPNTAPLPDLHADFWAHWTDDPLPAPAVAPAATAAAWQRAGKIVRLTRIAANQPAVARFEWTPPIALGANVALLAVCTTTGADALTPASQPVVMATLLRRERRAAFRVAPVTAFVPDLYIRDGLDDVGDLGGVAFGGRSPDIIVVFNDPGNPVTAFADAGDPRSSDRIRVGGNNLIYVRVHNRATFDTSADVELFWARPNPATVAAPGPGGPPFDNTQWQAVTAVGTALDVNVPASGAAFVRFDLPNAPAPEAGTPAALALIALIKSHVGPDAEPVRSRVTDLATFWRFFRELADSNNAALRAIRYE